jgi:hypothetical protein
LRPRAPAQEPCYSPSSRAGVGGTARPTRWTAPPPRGVDISASLLWPRLRHDVQRWRQATAPPALGCERGLSRPRDRANRIHGREAEKARAPVLRAEAAQRTCPSQIEQQQLVGNLTEDLEQFGKLLVAPFGVICMKIREKRIRGN